MKSRIVLLSALLLAIGGMALHAQQASLQQRMGAEDFKAAGLDKLSPTELQHLEQWLADHDKAPVKMVDASGEPVFYASGAKRQTIHAHLAGAFEGWHGKDVVALDNGQRWKQVGDDKPVCKRADKPAVVVKPSILGNWLMYVDGCSDSVHTRRVQ
jgi:hypothetical protein